MVATATQDLKWAIASLRKLLPPGEQMTDDELLRRRRELLVPVDLGPVPPSRRGRPLQDWKHDGDAELRRAGLNASDRRELLAVLGFVED